MFLRVFISCFFVDRFFNPSARNDPRNNTNEDTKSHEIPSSSTAMKKIIPTIIAIVCFSLLAVGQTSGNKQPANQRTHKMQKQTTVSRRVVSTSARQSNIPLSQAIVASGDFVFVSGQIGVDPKTGEFAGAGLEEQAEQVLRNLSAVLEAAGSDLNHVVKTTVFLADMNDFNAMNEIYRRYFKEDPPARSTVQVARLPRNARIEIEAIALVKK